MADTVRKCKEYGVKIGARKSYLVARTGANVLGLPHNLCGPYRNLKIMDPWLPGFDDLIEMSKY